MEEHDFPRKKEESSGSPAWVMTFADLMSLLMCFFVLLLAFSEMDVQKFKQLAGSMKNAFGVQRDIIAHEIPKGTSIVKKEFSPGVTKDTVRNKVRQDSVDTELQFQTKEDARRIALELQEEIKEGKIEVEAYGKTIVLHVLEKGAFESGLADLTPEFLHTMHKIRDVIEPVEGRIKVAGHTDDIPISNDRFRSNWDLSTARAVSVVHELVKDDLIAQDRIEVSGFADNRPRQPNSTEANRAKNRRVDITIIQLENASHHAIP